MSPFTCDSPGCGGDAKVGGKCLKCYKIGYDGRQQAEEQSATTNALREPAGGTSGDERCADCGKAQKGKRFFKGRCGSCHMNGIKKSGSKPGRKKKDKEYALPDPPRGTIAQVPMQRETDSDNDIVQVLLDGLHASLEAARKHHQALKAIQELTGARIDVPDISF